jgi:hypothetical protein
MKKSTNAPFVDLGAARRLARAQLFVAYLFGVLQTFRVPGIEHPLQLTHLKSINLDVGATRLPREAYEDRLVDWVRQRQVSTIVVRLHDAAPGKAEAEIDVVLADGGVALLCDYRLHAQNMSDWWLVSNQPDQVSFRLTANGPQPTFDVAWALAGLQQERLETRRIVGATLASEVFAKYVWG